MNMIITVDLIKGSYYFNGERLIASIKIKKENINKKSSVIAWVCAQIHCLCSFDNEKIKANYKQKPIMPQLGLTALVPNYGETGFCIYASKPKILTSDYTLQDDLLELYFDEIIPYTAYPSYKGVLCKFVYKLTISAQYLASPVNFVRIPFKILVLQGLSSELLQQSDEHYDKGVSNPFLATGKSDSYSKEKVLGLIQDIISFRDIRHYNIYSEQAKICKLSITKSFYRLGENIILYFDFVNADVSCIEVYAFLFEEEELILGLNDTFDISPTKHFRSYNKYSHIDENKLVVQGCKYNENRKFAINARFLSLTLNVPFVVTPTFTTTIVKHRWKVHIEFTFSRSHKFHTETQMSTALSPQPVTSYPISSETNLRENLTADDNAPPRDNNIDSLSLEKLNLKPEISPDEGDDSDWVLSSQTPDSLLEAHISKDFNLNQRSLDESCQFSNSTKFPCFEDAETLVWDFPIKIFPTNPLNISAQYSIGKISTVI